MQDVHDGHLVDSMSYLKLALNTLAFCGGLKGETRVLDEIGRQVCGPEFGSEFQKPHRCSTNFNHDSPVHGLLPNCAHQWTQWHGLGLSPPLLEATQTQRVPYRGAQGVGGFCCINSIAFERLHIWA